MTAPITVIVAYHLKFYEHLPKLFPQNAGMVKLFESNAEMVEATAKRNWDAIRSSSLRDT